MAVSSETICAVATPSGRGGISVIRISGASAYQVAENLTSLKLLPRHAHYGAFYSASGEVIDSGISLFFPGPDSFTGEDVVEIQAHGGPFVVDMLLQEILSQGCE